MYQVDEQDFADNIESIRVCNVPAVLLEGDAIKVVEDSSLKDKLVIEANERIKSYGLNFTYTCAGSTLFVYWARNKNSNLKALSDLGFTLRVPTGRQIDVTIA